MAYDSRIAVVSPVLTYFCTLAYNHRHGCKKDGRDDIKKVAELDSSVAKSD